METLPPIEPNSNPDDPKGPIRGRGAQIDPANRFLAHSTFQDHELHDSFVNLEDDPTARKTKFIEVFPKTILNKVTSPDLPMEYSMNPYQGCEHGCIYCYARNSHEYYGYSAGLDFESIIQVKKSAPALLEKALSNPNWKPSAISLSGNTDCYQPAEARYRITRGLLQVLNHYGNPVGIISKNVLMLRDLDILQEMARRRLVHVYVSITTLNEKLRRVLEPRTATSVQKLAMIRKLTDAGIPVGIMTAPIIPSLNDHEIPALIRACADAGALTAGRTVVRLNGAIAEIFRNWVEIQFPDRAAKIINQIEDMHGGKINDSRFGTRMRGEGNWAAMIHEVHGKAVRKYMAGRAMPPYNYGAFTPGGQLSLF